MKKFVFGLQRFAEEETTTTETTSTETNTDAETVATEAAADEAEATEDSTVTTGSVTITVKDSDENALEGVTLAYTVNSATCEGETDSSGQLAVSDLPAGTYNFAATFSGYASGNVDVEVVAAETVNGVITLTAETTTTDTTTLNTALSSAIATATSADSLDDVADAVAEAATTILTTATSTGSSSIITELLDEIKTTNNIWVKIRNIAEIGLATVGIAKGTDWVKSKL